MSDSKKLSFERKCQLGEETTLGPCLGLCFNKQTCEMYNKGYQKGYAGALAASGTEPGGDGSIAVWDAARGSALAQQARKDDPWAPSRANVFGEAQQAQPEADLVTKIRELGCPYHDTLTSAPCCHVVREYQSLLDSQ